MIKTAFALTFHVLAAVVWVGGMFAAYLCLRPAASALEAPQRLVLWRNFFARFFPWVWASVLALVASGYWMLLTGFGGFAGAPLYVDLMQTIGWVMIALFAFLFHGPWLAFKRAVDARDWAAAAPQLDRIRDIVRINLPLGLIVVAIGGTGRYWGF
ncbi:MAG TPA: CopD family protein [Pseudolabrys sp.]|nr:CopD family protein [Pseudolabrys sp.]